MSPSTFREHFRALTGVSPLQYQKQLRLQEARQLYLLNENLDAGSAGGRVGYESPSQFSLRITVDCSARRPSVCHAHAAASRRRRAKPTSSRREVRSSWSQVARSIVPTAARVSMNLKRFQAVA